MRKIYNKLVRDNIPAHIEATGKQFETAVYTNKSYRQALNQKLVEETNELITSTNQQELIEEMADVYEVLDAILTLNNIEQSEVLAIQTEKRIERGGFTKRLQLLWVDHL